MDNEQLLFNEFQEAVRDGTKQDVLDVLSTKDFPYEFVSPTGRRPMHLVCERGHFEALKYLFSKGCDVFCLDKKHATPMHYAAKSGCAACVRFLLFKGMTASGLPEGVEGETAFHWAVWYTKLEAAMELFKHDPSVVDALDKDGETVLHWACNNNRVSVARKLVTEFKCDPEKRNSVGATPLHCCAAQGDKELATVLIDEFNVNVNAQDMHRDTPLHTAVSFDNVEMVELLLCHKADHTLKNNDGFTPLKLAEHLSISGGIVTLLEGAEQGSFHDVLETFRRDQKSVNALSHAVEAARLAGAN